MSDPLRKDNAIKLQKGTDVTVLDGGVNLGLKLCY